MRSASGISSIRLGSRSPEGTLGASQRRCSPVLTPFWSWRPSFFLPGCSARRRAVFLFVITMRGPRLEGTRSPSRQRSIVFPSQFRAVGRPEGTIGTNQRRFSLVLVSVMRRLLLPEGTRGTTQRGMVTSFASAIFSSSGTLSFRRRPQLAFFSGPRASIFPASVRRSGSRRSGL